jgi:hypothetical protein
LVETRASPSLEIERSAVPTGEARDTFARPSTCATK